VRNFGEHNWGISASGGNDSVAVYALSYDPVSTLHRFAEAHGITYPLLSDEGSAVITELGLLNVTLEEERKAYNRPVEDRHRGIPYPGSFLLDEDGVVVGKRFEDSHRVRPTANTLMSQFFGAGENSPEGVVQAASPGVQVAAWLDSGVLAANQLQNVHVRFQLDEGVHLYAEPVPPNFRGVDVRLTGDDRIHVEETAPLVGHEFSIEGLDEQFFVVEGTVDMSIPFFLLTNRDTAGDGSRVVPFRVVVSYQACTADDCYLPERVELILDLREEPNPGYETKDLAALAPLVMRRIVEGPKGEAELLALVNSALEGVNVNVAEVSDTLSALKGRGLITRDPDGNWREV